MLRIENGRVVDLSDLSEADEQQLFARKDLTRDENCNVLAEFGVGINPGARWKENAVESEQTRGTCHFGFGHNVEYGWQNTSSYHFGFVVLRPIIEVDGRCICRAGQYSF
jgi:leucyl aminopeptidase (aminopeptidase T)